jgi:hypothetical protein
MVVRIRRPSKGAHFIHPADPAPRTAVLAAGFRQTRLARVFPLGWNGQAARFSRASVAAPLEQMLRVARAGWRVEHSIVVFTYPGEPGLSARHRESLWKAFEVPVFEQYLGYNSELLATECDAHAGLHVVSRHEDLDPDLDLDHDVCACGNPAPRLSRGSRIDELAALLS